MNIITLETFREGKLRQREQTHNLITSLGNTYLKYKKHAAFYTGMTAGNITHAAPSDVFGNILLLGDNSAPAASEEFAPGNIIAWANKTAYAGADTKRGTPNLALSFCTDALARWVFEFPTHAGNSAIINSIGWAYSMNANEPIQAGYTLKGNSIDIQTVLSQPNGKTYFWYQDENYLWVGCHNSNSTIRPNLYKIDPANMTVLDSYENFPATVMEIPKDIVVLNGYLYVLSANTTGSEKVYKFDLSNQSLAATIPVQYVKYLTSDGTNFYTGWYNGTRKIEKRDINFNVIADIAYNYTFYALSIIDNNFWVFGNVSGSYYIWIYDKSLNLLHRLYIPQSGPAGKIIKLFGEYQITYDNSPTGYSNILKDFTFKSMGARGLLSAPIQKTAADTMRLTYDFLL